MANEDLDYFTRVLNAEKPPSQYEVLDNVGTAQQLRPETDIRALTRILAGAGKPTPPPDGSSLTPMDYLGMMTNMLRKSVFPAETPANAMGVPGQAPPPKKDASQLPQDKKAPESVAYNPTQTNVATKSVPSTAPRSVGEILYGPEGQEEAIPVNVPAPVAPQAQVPQPAAAPTGMENFQRFMLQTGLSLMAGGFGNPLSQIGTAAGEGVEAIGREEKTRQGRDSEKMDQFFKTRQLDISQQNADSAGVRATAAVESSRSKRLGKTTLEERATEGMDPEAQAYFRTRLKAMNKATQPDPLSDETPMTPDAYYQQLLKETQTLDVRARANKGKLRADEVSPKALEAVVADPAKEQILLNQVRADPIQLGLLRKRLEAARGQTNAGR